MLKNIFTLFITFLIFSPIAESHALSSNKATQHQDLVYLQTKIAEEGKSNSSAVEAVMSANADHSGIEFSIDLNEVSSELKRPHNVPRAEWENFLKFWIAERHTEFYSENNIFNFTLIDLDEDGQKDLLVNTYVGGTGLFSEMAVFKRDPIEGFTTTAGENNVSSFSINGRGSDEAIYILKLSGKIYIAYRDSTYGQDMITLHHPLQSFTAVNDSESLRVTYHYQHQALSAVGEYRWDDSPAFADEVVIITAANEQLSRLAQGHELSAERCPAPDSTDAELEQLWPWNGPGHYTFEVVTHFALPTLAGCYSAQLVCLANSYLTSYEHYCSLQLADAPEGESSTLPLHTIREIVDVRVVSTP